MFTYLCRQPISSRQNSFCLRASPHQKLLRMVRPSLLDLRFTGDPWIVGGEEDGTFTLCLGDYCLAGIRGVTFDLPSFNHVFDRLRNRRARRRARAS